MYVCYACDIYMRLSAVYVILDDSDPEVHGNMVSQQQLPGAPRRLGRGRDDRRVPIYDMSTGVVPFMGCMGVDRTPL